MTASIVDDIITQVTGGPGKLLSDTDTDSEFEKLPGDYAKFRYEVFSTTETKARQLYARLAYYDLDIMHIDEGVSGDCLFEAILAMVPHPSNVTPQHLRLEVVWFLCGVNRTTLLKALKNVLVARDISYYTLCTRLLKPGEWGGMETLLFVRWSWKLCLTVINPGHDEFIHHEAAVKDSHLILAYNGNTHYMPTGNQHIFYIYYDITYETVLSTENSLL